MFVGLDKLIPREDPEFKSPKRDENYQADFISRVWAAMFKGNTDNTPAKERCDNVLEIDQRAVTFIGDFPFRGTVRYIGEEKDARGNVQTIVGLQMVRYFYLMREITAQCNNYYE